MTLPPATSVGSARRAGNRSNAWAGLSTRSRHTLDVRRIPPRRGRYNLPNVGVFLWRLTSYGLTDATARRLDDHRYFFSPLGRDTPLFTLPETRVEFSGPSNRLNVPDPIGRRTLNQYFADYYGPDKSILLKDGAGVIDAGQITVCGLSDVPGGAWAHRPRQKIAVDPVLGRIAFPSLEPPPADVRVTFQYGFSADLGGGEYDRAATVADEAIFRQTTVWQIGVSGALPAEPGQVVNTFGEALAAWNAQPPGTVGVIVVMDSASYPVPGEDEIYVGAGSKLLVIAGDWPVEEIAGGQRGRPAGQFNASGHRPHLQGDLTVRGEASGAFYLNGLLVEGRLQVDGAAFGQVSVRHCTLLPGTGVRRDQYPQFPGEASLRLTTPDAGLEIDHSVVGGLRVHATVSTSVTASVVDATSPCGVAFSGLDDMAAGGTLRFANSTLIGKVHTDLLELATNTIFFARLASHDLWAAPVWSEQRQTGCVRFSYVPPGSRTPRRYRCQPASDETAVTVVPQFGSLRYGDPDYAQLSRRCPDEIFKGADDESEMGVFHDLFEPQRITNLEVRLGEYLRFGLEAGIFFEPQLHHPPTVAPLDYAAVDLCGDPVAFLPGIGTALL